MKSILVLVVFAFISLNALSQPNSSSRLALCVEKQSLDSRKEFVFKPNNRLRIKTKIGDKYYSKDYTFSSQFVVMNQKDTILFDDISRIQGKVYDHTDDKTFGVITVAIASPIAAFGVLDFIVEGDPGAAIVGILFGCITNAGIRLAGARKFRLSQNCYLKAIEQ
jgi:hypothetical protein